MSRFDLPEGVVLLTGLEKALVGVGSQWTRKPLAVYSERKIYLALESQGMAPEEALEWFTHNVQCLWCGEQTPLILEDTYDPDHL